MKNKNSRLIATSETIPERIKRLRETAELSQSQLAEMVGTKQSRISDIEKGKGYLYAEELPLYAEALNTTVSYLVTRIEPQNETVSSELGLSNHSIEVLRNQENEDVRNLINILLVNKTVLNWLYAYIIGDFSTIDYRLPDQKTITLETKNLVGFYPEFQEKAMALIVMDFLKAIRDAFQSTHTLNPDEKQDSESMNKSMNDQ